MPRARRWSESCSSRSTASTWKKELGVAITIEFLELKTLWQNQESKTYSVGLVNFIADFADPGSLLDCFSTGNAYNYPGWSSPAYDRPDG